MNGRILFRRISGVLGVITTYGLHEYEKNNQKIRYIACDENSIKATWYPGKYLVDIYTSLAYSSDDIHFLKYIDKDEKNRLMSWPSMENGLQLRVEDEKLLQQLLIELKTSQNNKELASVYTRKIEDILYGKGLTAQDRQNHLLKYGCAEYTDEALRLIADSVKTWKYRGIIEIGAGYFMSLNGCDIF